MKLPKSKHRKLLDRVRELEEYLGIAWAEDGYGGQEHVKKEWGVLPHLIKTLEELETKKKGRR